MKPSVSVLHGDSFNGRAPPRKAEAHAFLCTFRRVKLVPGDGDVDLLCGFHP